MQANTVTKGIMPRILKQHFYAIPSLSVSSSIYFLLACGLLSSCYGPRIDTIDATNVLTKKTEASTDLKVARFLSLAEDAFSRQRLTSPIDDNAYLWYSQVLALNPNNTTAKYGISDIVEQYLSWAIKTFETDSLARALDYIAKAKSVDDTHSNIALVEANIINRSLIFETSFTINQQKLASRHKSVKVQMRDIAMEIDRLNAPVLIQARSDSEGRWIYKQLNFHSTMRIRATFKISQSPQVTLHY